MLHSHPWWKFAIGDPAFLCFVWLKSSGLCAPIELLWSWQLDTDSTTLFFYQGTNILTSALKSAILTRASRVGVDSFLEPTLSACFFIFGTSTSASFFQPQILLTFIKRTNRDVFGYRHGPISVKAAETRAAHIWLPRKSRTNRKNKYFCLWRMWLLWIFQSTPWSFLNA